MVLEGSHGKPHPRAGARQTEGSTQRRRRRHQGGWTHRGSPHARPRGRDVRGHPRDRQGRHPGHSPLDRPRHGGRRAAPLPRDEGDDRSRDRRRLLLRLRQARRRLQRRGPRHDREGDARRHREEHAVPARGRLAERGARAVREDERNVQGRDHPLDPGERGDQPLQARHARRRRVGRRLRGTPRPVDRLPSRGEAHERRRSVLAR